MARIFYCPPETFTDEDGNVRPSIPFEFERSENRRVFLSPHAYFKRVREEYEIGLITNPQTKQPVIGKNGKPKILKGKRDVYVLDTEKNEKMKKGLIPPPDNSLEISRAESEFLRQNADLASFTQYLKSEADVREAQKTHMQEMERKFLAERDAVILKHKDEMRKLQESLDIERRQREIAEKERQEKAPSKKG